MTKPQSTLELAEQIWRDPEIQFVDPDDDEHWRRILDRLAGIIEAYAREREASAIEEAARIFESEYSNYGSPIMGVIRGLKAIGIFADARRQPQPERMQPAGEANDRS